MKGCMQGNAFEIEDSHLKRSSNIGPLEFRSVGQNIEPLDQQANAWPTELPANQKPCLYYVKNLHYVWPNLACDLEIAKHS